MTEKDFSLTFLELRKANVTRCEDVFHSLNSWSVNDWSTATAGEIGEAVEVFGKLIQFLNTAKKIRRSEQGTFNNETLEHLLNQLSNEIADIVIYADLLAARLNIDLAKAVIEKFNEVSEKRGSQIKL
jgi:NTP pyrophosphatase (non-canonical NTP hydrolase)